MLLRYILFAVLASALNLGVQKLVIWLCEIGLTAVSFPVADFVQGMIGMKPDSLFLYTAMASATIAGLVFKYILDKNFVFSHTAESKKQEASTFLLYSLMGLITTFIFWGVEMGFHFFVGTENAKFVGAIIGLGIGYVVKFFLDRRFVFNKTAAQ